MRSGGELALLATLRVRRVLEAVHRDLAERRRDRVLELAGEQVEPLARVVLGGEKPLERERLAEHRGGLGRRQRRRRVEVSERLRQRPVERVADLVGEREDRATVARVVHEDVRVHARDVRGAERAVALVGSHGRVDPALVEESLDGVPRLAREVGVRADDDLARLVPRRLRGVLGDGREAVVVLEPVETEQLRLESVVALRHVVARRRSVDQRLHRLVGRLVREVPRGDPGRVAAQPVVDPLVDEDRVEDGRARAQARLRAPR